MCYLILSVVYRKPSSIFQTFQIKSLKWQKITLKLVEKEQDCKDINAIRKFENFEEILFAVEGRQNNMGKMLKYLADHETQHTFRELFGIESKMPAKSTD